MRLWAALFAAACLTACAPHATTSWGRADVSLTQLLTDASDCMVAAADVRAEPEVLTQGRGGVAAATAGAKMGSAEAAAASHDALMEHVARMEDAQIRADTRARQRAHDACLAERGYTEFRLTPEQEEHLRTLPEGSRERRDYLHRLGADPQVLASQRL